MSGKRWPEMSTMQEMAREYRESAARIAMRIRELERAGADLQRIQTLRNLLRETRELQRALDGYYTIPRTAGLTAVDWRARGPSRDDH